jgi:hypothetical protein
MFFKPKGVLFTARERWSASWETRRTASQSSERSSVTVLLLSRGRTAS